MKALGKVIIATIITCTSVHAAPYLSIGGGSMAVQVSELPIYASKQSDSSWVPTFNFALGWNINESFATEISGTASGTTQIQTDPSTAYIPPNVRFTAPTTVYDTEFQSLALRLRYKKSLNDEISGLAYVGPALISAEAIGKNGHSPIRYSGSAYTIQTAFGLEYKKSEKDAVRLLIEHNAEREIDRSVRVGGTAIQLSYVRGF